MKYFSIFILLLSFALTSNAQENETKSDDSIIVDFSDIEPMFPGGEDAMAIFIQSNIVYPATARKKNQQGIVFVQFVVNTDGSICDVVVLKSVCSSLDAEAMRVIKLMPNWIPGSQKGKPVRVRYIIPINFQITK